MSDPRRFGKYSKTIRNLQAGTAALHEQCNKILAEKDAEIARLRAQVERRRLTRDEAIKLCNDFLEANRQYDYAPVGGPVRSKALANLNRMRWALLDAITSKD